MKLNIYLLEELSKQLWSLVVSVKENLPSYIIYLKAKTKFIYEVNMWRRKAARKIILHRMMVSYTNKCNMSSGTVTNWKNHIFSISKISHISLVYGEYISLLDWQEPTCVSVRRKNGRYDAIPKWYKETSTRLAGQWTGFSYIYFFKWIIHVGYCLSFTILRMIG